MFTPPAERELWPGRLEPVQVAYYRQVLVAHTDDLVLGVCPVCRATRCEDWCTAYDRLAAAGELMASPERWHSIAKADRKPWR